VFTYPDSKAQIICNIPRFARKIELSQKPGFTIQPIKYTIQAI
jgi:hypothetical protein